MRNIFQVSHILQFILRFQVQYSECNINSAVWQMFSADQIADIFTCSRQTQLNALQRFFYKA